MTKNSPWSDIDKTAIDFISTWLKESKPKTSRSEVARLLGYTYQAMRKKFNHDNSPLTLGEFEKLCRFFHKNSASEWMQILKAVAIKNNDLNEAKLIDDMLNDHQVKNAIVNLAVTYLHPSATIDDISDPAVRAEIKNARKGNDKEDKKEI
ncbi:hypothetical protein [Bifidobacterium aquikefiri]|uniref:hypothetical protein n=1 Tax=Bifidobacterium aquikefiri TaxID=1653207 RepID=UPI0039E9237E